MRARSLTLGLVGGLVAVAGLGVAAAVLLPRLRRRFSTPPAAEEEVAIDEELVDIPEEVLVADPDELVTEVVVVPPIKDSGELYGSHTIPASDRSHPDDDQAQAVGENWIEALAEDAVEGGPLPEQQLDFTDLDDIEHPNTETKDQPIADKGSAGPRGL
jgi:hypothetical protein